jgi:uncharacterized protein (TIGR03437 family)
MGTCKRLRYLAASVCLAGALAVAQPRRITGRIDNSRTVALTGHVRPQANAQNDRGEVAGTFPLPGVTLIFRPSAAQQADLDQLLANQQDPASPDYHRWLTPEQYANRFGMAPSDMAQVVSWLTSEGFRIDNVARSRTFVNFSGTAALAQRAFHTRIHHYDVNGTLHYANATAPEIPATLAGMVASFHGLSDFRMKPRMKEPVQPRLSGSGGSHHLGPADFATIFNVAPLYAEGIDGSGQKIAVVGQTALRTNSTTGAATDVQAFRDQFGLGPANLQLVKASGNPGVVSGDIEESNLDVEWAGAIAKNATIIFYYSNDVWISAMHAVDDNAAPILSMSYGACEAWDMLDLPSFRNTVQQANAQGITWFAASGDAGAADCEGQNATITQNGAAVDIPASIPEVTGMGGTEFNDDESSGYWSSAGLAQRYIPERAWNDTDAEEQDSFSATGGGTSAYFSRPPWQTGTGVPDDNWRHVPDLAFPASAAHDSYTYYSSSTRYAGGTSFGAPTMAGVFALLNQYLAMNGVQPGLGNINPAVYSMYRGGAGFFHDITSGNNKVRCSSGTPGCVNGLVGFSAGPGYDQVTGLGSVDVYNLVHQWTQPVMTVSPPVLPTVSPNPAYQHTPDGSGNSWTFTIALNEATGVAATLTDFTVNGTSYASDIVKLFGTNSIAPHGQISAAYGVANLTPPANIVLGFAGTVGSGATWTTQISVPALGPDHVRIDGISNAATGQQVYAPGMLLSVYGASMGGYVQSASAIPLPDLMAGFEADINGVSAPLYYVSPNQVNIQIPYETSAGTATLTLGNPFENQTYKFTVSSAGPGIFARPDGSVATSFPPLRGQDIDMYITGEGAVRPSLATGSTPSASTPLANLPKPRQNVTVTVGGAPATIDFIGIPPGLVGVTQINIKIPDSISPGPQPVVVTVGAVQSPAATLNVQ